jgi:fatty acid desaturase
MVSGHATAGTVASRMDLHPASFYVKELRDRLPPAAFAPARSRLWWLPVHLAVVVTGIAVIAAGLLPWFAVPVVVIAIGASFAGLTFVGHELLHGGMLRGHSALRTLLGWVCFAPFNLSPRLWIAWHNRTHHAHTNHAGADPDMYPTLARYTKGGRAKFSIDNFAIGGGRWRGAFSLLVGFIVHGKSILLGGRARIGISRRTYAAAVAETVLSVVLWTAVAIAIGGVAFIFAFAIPIVIADVIVMAFILTNHGLNPGTDVNDPLVNSMSIQLPRWLEWLTLGFGYHVEHHIFPAMSARHGGLVRDAIRAHWPERYHTMPLLHALHALHVTGRVYKDPSTLADPRSGGEWKALAPRSLAA